MISLDSVSRRTQEIYRRFYGEREAQRYENLYYIFERMAAHVDARECGARIEIDYIGLGEIVRSYFFDVIRYKDYHFDPQMPDRSETSVAGGEDDLTRVPLGIDPLSPEWTEHVHRTAKLNGSKVAAFTVKWILRYKPISVISAEKLVHDISSTTPSAHPKELSSFLINVNEHFALLCALVALEVDLQDISRKKFDELIYCFRFRNFDESAYFMILSRDYLCEN